MKHCPVCGADLAQARRAKNVQMVQRWQRANPERYRRYMRGYMRRYRARKRAAAAWGLIS